MSAEKWVPPNEEERKCLIALKKARHETKMQHIPCRNIAEKGHCWRGKNCWFSHVHKPHMEENRRLEAENTELRHKLQLAQAPLQLAQTQLQLADANALLVDKDRVISEQREELNRKRC